MALSVGDKLPAADLTRMGANGPESVALADMVAGRKVVLFGLPGAFTGVCTEAHVPSFMRVREALGAKGVDDVICVTVNDPFVVAAWDEATGAGAAGLTLLADPSGDFIKAIGMNFDAPPVGFFGRSSRFAAYLEDGEVKVMNTGDEPGVCEITAGETMLEAL